MKKIIFLFIGLVVGIFVGANIGFRFTQDFSAQAVVDVLEETYSGVQADYSGSVAQEYGQKFADEFRQELLVKKQEIGQEIRLSLRSYVSQKIASWF